MSEQPWFVYGLIAGLTVVTIVTRSAFLVLGDYIPLPEGVKRGLRYAPACALVAIVVPDLFLPGGAFVMPWSNPRLWGAFVATAAILATRNMLVAIVMGMVGFWAVRWLIGL